MPQIGTRVKKLTQIVQCLKLNDYTVSTTSTTDLCKSHYVSVRQLLRNRECYVCKSNDSKTWTLIMSEDMDMTSESYDDLQPYQWLCCTCKHALHSSSKTVHVSKYSQNRSELLSIAMKQIDDSIGCLLDNILELYKQSLSKSDVDEFGMRRELVMCRRWIIKQLKDKFCYFSPKGSKRKYSMFFDSSAVQGRGVEFLYKTLLERKLDVDKDHEFIEKLRLLVVNQCQMFPSATCFDYRSMFKEGVQENAFDKHINQKLLNILVKITTANVSVDRNKCPGKLYEHSKKLKLIMIIAILANAMDPRNIFIQTLLGLACYAQGLRDKGFKIFNSFGVICSIFNIRKHGTRWARLRSAIDELDRQRLWRTTFDNLDFKMKFAKKVEVQDSSCVLNRMFHLLTSQVVFRKNPDPCTCPKEKLKSIVRIEPMYLKESHFSVEYCNGQWNKFCRGVVRTICGMFGSTEELSLLGSLRSRMSHWTPDKPDTIVYTTVDEAYSGSVDDVGKYLVKLKHDLKIGEEGYPKYVVVGGDQQTYAHMSNLKLKYPGHYDWIYAVPGDWHIMKNTAEVFKAILLDGGFSVFARTCGHKGDVKQWQDIHNVLVAMYEAKMKYAVTQFCKSKGINPDDIGDAEVVDSFWTWLKTYSECYPQNELSSFWSQILIYLHAYIGFYFAVRSGNWFLRNSCLRVISELYFAYARNKYEVLSINAIANTCTYPSELIHHFVHGQWTVSVKGRQFHNLALDEAHECIINKNLKSITTRPSHFRMVELANFMAYLDVVMNGFEDQVFKWHVNTEYEKKVSSKRSDVLFKLVSNVALFSCDSTSRPLHNAFVENPLNLDPSNITDLMSITKVGHDRLLSYVRQYVLNPPTELRQKRSRKKLKTFTMPKSSNAKLRSEANQTALLLTSAYKRLVAAGPLYCRTYPLPLALCSPDGTMRPCSKSVFRDSLIKLFPDTNMFVTSCPLLSRELPPVQDLEIIIDFLFLLHQPPPPDVLNFLDFSKYLWKKIVINLGVNRKAGTIKIIVDKPSFLPSPRTLLHKKRASKSGIMATNECTIGDTNNVPHCSSYQAMLANPLLKSKLIAYVMKAFQDFACVEHITSILVLDYEGVESPVCILPSGTVMNVPCLSNQLGEADYNVWYHCIQSLSNNVIIVGSDTDLWVYGMAFKESGWLRNKQVYVERTLNAEFVDICEIYNIVQSHPILSKTPYPLNSLVALYVLSGCDYISSFFKTSKQAFLTPFSEHCLYICENGPIVEMKDVEDGCIINDISTDAWYRLVCSVYLVKHKTLFQSESIPSLHKSLTVQLNAKKIRLMKCLAYKDMNPLRSISDWHTFTHRVCFHHSTGSKHHESLLIPSMGALKYQTINALFVCVKDNVLLCI